MAVPDKVLPLYASRRCHFMGKGTSASSISTDATGVGISVDRANTGVSGQRPDAVGKPAEPHQTGCWFYTSANPTCRQLMPNQADAFVLPAQFTYGNAGRNTMRGDGLMQFDMSLI